MKKALLITLICVTVNAFAQQDTLKYRISLTDKAGTTYSLDRPEEFLSEKAIARRTRQQLPVDLTDLPVSEKYIEAIRAMGAKIVVTGKWDNFVTVSCNDSTLIDQIAQFSFVRSTEKVWEKPKKNKKQYATQRDSLVNKTVEHENLYGQAFQQIEKSNGHKLHEAGFKGEGMTIAVIDAGFHNADRIPLLANVRILGTKDFVGPAEADIFAENSHGMKVLSCMATNQPHVMIGTAPGASYWLIRTEDEYSECLVEEDYAAAAFEFADSVGVDVVNTSLGYYAFDDKQKNYRYRDLNGQYSLMSRQASKAVDKGMLIVCSAGNCGIDSWKKITPPGDAEHVITVGAIAKNSELAPFSSVGNTSDNRIKPDVMAIGMFADAVGTNGQLSFATGTSFSAPIMCGMVACLWQACPELTVKQLIELVRKSGDRADYPDNIYGYGIPDLWKAYEMQSGKNN